MWGIKERVKILPKPPLPQEVTIQEKEKAGEGKVDDNFIITTEVQALKSSSPARHPGGVKGSDISIASPVAAFR